MEPECSLPHSQVPATCHYTKVQVRGECTFVTRPGFRVRSCQHLAQPTSWRTTPCRLSATVYPIYSQLPSILQAVTPSATLRSAMPWRQGPTYHDLLLHLTNVNSSSLCIWMGLEMKLDTHSLWYTIHAIRAIHITWGNEGGPMLHQYFFQPKNSFLCLTSWRGQKLCRQWKKGTYVYWGLVQTNPPLFITWLPCKLKFLIFTVNLSTQPPPRGSVISQETPMPRATQLAIYKYQYGICIFL